MLLSILIPTIGRKELKQCVESFVAAIKYAGIEDDVELIIGDNKAGQDIKRFIAEVVSKNKYIKHVVYQKYEPTAEDSLIRLIPLAKGKYILTAGDDDCIIKEGIKNISYVLEKYNPNFLLLNSILYNKKFTAAHVDIASDTNVVMWQDGKGMFADLGIIGMTTSFSLTCYKREDFDIEIWRNFIKTARIYSYSVALFAMFYHKKCILLKAPCIVGKYNNPKKELKRISHYSINKENGIKFSAWTDGLLKLIHHASKQLNIQVEEVLAFNNLTLSSKGEYNYGNLQAAILNVFISQLRYYKHNPLMLIWQKKRLLNCLNTMLKVMPSNTILGVKLLIELQKILTYINSQKIFKIIRISSKLIKSINKIAVEITVFYTNEITSRGEVYFKLGNSIKPFKYAGLPNKIFNVDHNLPNPTLTVLIPTIGRMDDLRVTLTTFIASIKKYHLEDVVQIMVADNSSNESTYRLVNELGLQHSFIKYFKHSVFRKSAEESVLYSIESTEGKYVWIFGDDDIPEVEALPKILYKLEENPALVLVNLNFIGSYKTSKLIPLCEDVTFEKGVEVFKTQGFTSGLLGCMSSIIVQKSSCNFKVLEDIIKIAPIYSIPFFLFCMTHQKKVIITGEALFYYKSNSTESELKSIGGLSLKNHNLQFFAWHLGIIRLIKFASKYTGISANSMMHFSELTVDKLDGKYDKIYLYEFILHYINKEIMRSSLSSEVYTALQSEVTEFIAHLGNDVEGKITSGFKLANRQITQKFYNLLKGKF